jgi:hypothetical protein
LGAGSCTVNATNFNKSKYIGHTFMWQIFIDVTITTPNVGLRILTPPSFYMSGGTWHNMGATFLAIWDNGSGPEIVKAVTGDSGAGPYINLIRFSGVGFPAGGTNSIEFNIVTEV